MAGSGRSSQGNYWTDFRVATSCPKIRWTSVHVPIITDLGNTSGPDLAAMKKEPKGVVCGNRRPQFKFAIRPYRRRNRERTNA
jgi:hypothetical protein